MWGTAVWSWSWSGVLDCCVHLVSSEQKNFCYHRELECVGVGGSGLNGFLA